MSRALQNDANTQPCKGPYLPSYEESMQITQYYDSMRLPTYQSRSLIRYHPYLRFTRDNEGDFEKYKNTIYDDERIVLEIPPSLRRVRILSLVPPIRDVHSKDAIQSQQHASFPTESETGNPHAEPLVVPQNARANRQTEFARRVQRLLGVMDEFLSAVNRAHELHDAEYLSDSENASTSAETEDTLSESAPDDL